MRTMIGLISLLLLQSFGVQIFAFSTTVELGLFVSSDLAESFYNKYNLLHTGNREDVFKSNIVANYQSGISAMFRDSSLTSAGLNINIAITEVNIVQQRYWGSWSSLYDACSYQSKFPGRRDASLFIILSGGYLHKNMKFSAGVAFTDTMCNSKYHCGMVAEKPQLNSAYSRLAAHELGHVFGLIDQGYMLQNKFNQNPSLLGTGRYVEPLCTSSKVKSIMAGNGYTWSSCSVARFKSLIPNIACLNNIPSTKLDVKINHLLGARYPRREEQCYLYKEQTDPPNYSVYYNTPSSIVNPCRFGNNECYKHMPTTQYPHRTWYLDNNPLLTGTPCGTDKICLAGDCVPSSLLSNTKVKVTPKPDIGGSFTCPPEWTEYSDHCYKLYSVSNRITQAEAQQKCKNVKANLITINNPGLNNYIMQKFQVTGFWIGLHREGGVWKWYDGSPYRYNNWVINNPRSYQNCVSMGSSSYKDRWYSKSCSNYHHNCFHYICDIQLSVS